MGTPEQLTVQVLPDAKKEGAASSMTWWVSPGRSGLLAAYGTRQRLADQRAVYQHPYNTLFQGAVQGIVKKIKGTPWEINGGKTRATYYSNVFREAQFGRGWGEFIAAPLVDYLTLDIGGFIEVIAPGSPKRPPTGRIVGLSYLDALRCYPTGDPEFPVIYYSREGEMHLMHHTRVIRWVDMPTTDENFQGWGLSALSRSIAVIERQLFMSRYIRAKLDDLPPPGIIVGSNLNRSELDRAIAQYTVDTSNDSMAVTGRTMWLFGTNPQETAELNVTTFSQPPEGFDYPKYMDIDINQLALALGVDKQELWELNGVNVGSATQSEILHEKSQGKAYGDILVMQTRDWNKVLPEDLDFEFKVKDPMEEKNAAENASTWVNTIRQLDGIVSPELQLRILANQVRAIADAVIDIDGELVRMNDVDPEDPKTEAPSTVTENTQNDVINRNPGTAQDQRTKAISNTKEAFEDAFNFVLENARKEVYGKVRLRSIMMNLIREYGYKAYVDGKQEGGVDEPLTDAEEADALRILASQKTYVDLYVAKLLDTGISDAQATLKPQMWWKSIVEFQNAGRMSADANALYEWKLGKTEKHCPTCSKLNGQKHRMKEYVESGLLPKSSKLACAGYLCDCRIERAKGKPRGRLPSTKELAHEH